MLLSTATLTAQVPIVPLSEVRAGQRATGRTVFSGTTIEDFDVEILGVMRNVGPKQSVILGRLSGGPLEKTGVLQGMSGSPVYLDGRLLGAVALAFPLSTEPIAGIRPIEEMLRVRAARSTAARRQSLWETDLTKPLASSEEVLAGGSRLVEIATPVSFSGFTSGTLREFGPQLRALGLEPLQGGGGGRTKAAGDAPAVEPGSMISVLLLTGDMSVGADGTVTHVEGPKVYAFGHRFLSVGQTELPFARSEVLTLAPNLATSFKISSSQELVGTITADYSTAVQGLLGSHADTVPVTIRVSGPAAEGPPLTHSYHMGMVNDRFLSPFLLQLALYSAIDATERTVGASTVALRGSVEFDNGAGTVRLDDVFAGEGNVAMAASLGAAAPLAYLLQTGFDELRLKSVSLDVDVFAERRQWVIDQVWPSRKAARPGETVELMIVLSGENGAEQLRKVEYKVPPGSPLGPLYFTVADALTTNLMEYFHLVGQRMRTPSQVVNLVNELRSSTGAYVRVWRADRSFQIEGRSLPAPPPSVALVLGRSQPEAGGAASSYTSKVTEIRFDLGDAAVTGSKMTQVDIKE